MIKRNKKMSSKYGESWGEIAKDYDCYPQIVLHHLQMKKLI